MDELRKTAAGLAYRHMAGVGPLLVFLPGYMSDMTGTKAGALFDWARRCGRGCLLLDYSGCGASDGDFLDGSIARWTGDVLAVIDHVAPDARLLLVGSSMGGWIGLQAGEMLGERLAGFVGVAAAPDFVDWGLEMTAAEAAALAAEGFFSRASSYGGDYVYSRGFVEGAADCRMLGREIAISAPVRLLHGQRDDAVPWALSLEVAERLASEDVQAVLIKDGDHRLSREADIAVLVQLVAGLV